jgi:hypothetical protein
MSFWNNPGASFEGLMHDPWHSLENFGTSGLVPLIPYVAGAYLGPAGGAAGQAGVDYFSGNSNARTGKGIFGSLLSGAGKGYAGASAGNFIGGGGLDSLGSSFGGGGESGYGMLDSIGGNGGSFSGDAFQLGGSNGVGDVFGGWSPTGSDAGYSGSQLSFDELLNLNSAPYAGDAQYENQGLEEQARNTNVKSGSNTSWDRGDKTGFDPSSAQKLLSNLLKNQQGTSQQNATVYNNYKPTDVIRQPAFLGTTAPVDVQNTPLDLTALIKALRG